MFLLLFNICLLFVVIKCDNTHTISKDPPFLLLISMDGFRHNYLDRLSENDTKHFHDLIRNGVKATYVKNIFPSVTFPNHMTLLTGVYAETHGVTHNRFYDPFWNDTFFMKNYYQNLESRWFDNGAEPIWVTNQKGGPKRYSGSMLWPGGIAPVKGVQPRVLPHAYLYNTTAQISFQHRIDYIISWFKDPNRPINLGLLYYPEPDEVGHQFGPESKEVNEEIFKLDAALGYLKQQLEKHKLLEKMNIIVTADHGMVEVGKDFVNLDTYLDPSLYTTPSHGSNMVVPEIRPKKGFKDIVKTKLLRMQNEEKHKVYVYQKDGEQLRHLHYNDNSRIMPFVLEPKKGYLIGTNKTIAEFKKMVQNGVHGAHGYDPGKVHDVHPFFIASGPAFKKGVISDPFDMVDIYSLMCHILEVEPAPNNGSLDKVIHLLVDKLESTENQSFTFTAITFLSVVLLAALVGGVFAIGAIRQSRILARRTPQHRKLVSTASVPDPGTHSLLSDQGDDDDDDDEF